MSDYFINSEDEDDEFLFFDNDTEIEENEFKTKCMLKCSIFCFFKLFPLIFLKWKCRQNQQQITKQ